MHRSIIASFVFSAFAVFGSGPEANAQENMIRQAAQNRNIHLPGRFTVQGKTFHDVAEVVLGNGQVFMRATLWELICSPFMSEWYVSSSGDIVVRVSFANPQPIFHLGTVAVFNGRQELDRDRIRLD
jgi:hypothetical protein